MSSRSSVGKGFCVDVLTTDTGAVFQMHDSVEPCISRGCQMSKPELVRFSSARMFLVPDDGTHRRPEAVGLHSAPCLLILFPG